MKRYPDGITGEHFYEKNAPKHTPPWVKRFAVPRSEGGSHINYVLCNDRATLLWATNLGDIGLRCSDLLSHSGDVIKAGAVCFEPDPVPIPARSSRGAIVTVQVAEDVSPGVYRGTLLVDGHPQLWLPLVLTLRPADG